jgi:hypothetical protein
VIAYDALPALMDKARDKSRSIGLRTRVRGVRSPRCGLWHYVIVPIVPRTIWYKVES